MPQLFMSPNICLTNLIEYLSAPIINQLVLWLSGKPIVSAMRVEFDRKSIALLTRKRIDILQTKIHPSI